MTTQTKTKEVKAFGGLAERFGGEGKIQWQVEKRDPAVDELSKPLPWYLQLFFVIVLSIVSEFYYQSGSIILLLGLGLVGLYNFRATQHDNIPSGTGYLPIIGHFLNVVQRWDTFYELELENFLKLGPKKHFSANLPLQKHFVFMTDPKIIDECFRTRFGNCWKGYELSLNMGPMFGDGIFATDGEKWKRHRQIASQMFTVRSLKDYMFQVFLQSTDVLVDKLEEFRNKNMEIDIYNMYNRLTLEAFSKVAFGIDVGCISSAPKEVKFATSFDRGFAICTKRFFDFTWPLQKLFNYGNEKELKSHLKTINKFIDSVIKERRLNYNDKSNLAKKFDLLSLFLQKNKNTSNKELRDVTVNFIIAGRDTTAQLLSWFTYNLTKKENKEIYDKLLEEIEKHISTEIDEPLDYKEIQHLDYLDDCFTESLRLRPSVPHLVRFSKVDMKLSDGHIIRKGDGVVVPTYAMGRLPWLWENPTKFDPSRYKNKTFLPCELPSFNIPPRLCLGKHVALLEAKIAIVKLLQKYHIEALPGQDVRYEFSATNQMKHGFKVKLTPRTTQN